MGPIYLYVYLYIYHLFLGTPAGDSHDLSLRSFLSLHAIILFSFFSHTTASSSYFTKDHAVAPSGSTILRDLIMFLPWRVLCLISPSLLPCLHRMEPRYLNSCILSILSSFSLVSYLFKHWALKVCIYYAL